MAAADAIGCRLKLSYPDIADFQASPQELLDIVGRNVRAFERGRNIPPECSFIRFEGPLREYGVKPLVPLCYAMKKDITLESSYRYKGRVFKRMRPLNN